METKVVLPSRCGDLEGLCDTGVSDKGVVITHPHPRYGGDMHNPVVAAIAAAYRKLGFTTLRFNFRGVGKSAGHFDQGIGERDDVRDAVSFLCDRELEAVHLSGYSFGAWVNAMALQGGLAVQGMTMVAPPVAFIDFEEGIRLPMLSAVVAGSRDEIAPPDLIRPSMGQWNPDARMDIIDDADHFFFGSLDEITRRLVQRIQYSE
jgi:alpha/beta superfamily hydrolase